MGRMRKKQQQKRQDELGGIRKNARIMTIGGIYGTVVQVRDDKKVVIKIDETTNTRMTISRSAVRSVLSGKEEEDEKETK
jgi:preprotein translocase subunit YajC